MKTQGVVTVPVQNGKVVKSGKAKQNTQNVSDTDFMTFMNDLSVFRKGSDNSVPPKEDRASDVRKDGVSFQKKDIQLKSSYRQDSDSHLIKQSDSSSTKSTKTTTSKNTRKPDVTRSDSSTVDRKETQQTSKKTGTTDTKDIKNRDTGVSGPETEDNTVDEAGAMEDFTSNILDTIKEDLGVDDDTINAAMQSLGLTFTDLSIPSNAAQLYMTITGDSRSDLLTSDNFLGFLDDLQEIFSQAPDDIMDQMRPVTDDEAAGLQDMLSDLNTQQNVTDDTTVTVQNTDDQMDVRVVNVVTEGSVQEDAKAQPVADTAISTDSNTDTQTTTTLVNPQQQSQQNTDTSDMTGQENLFGKQQNSQQTESVNTNVAQTTVTMTQTEVSFTETITQVTKYTDINTDNIIQQIVDKAKQTIGTTVKSLEMELNPQSLGKIFLQVAEKSGDVTAHLYAQNEAVKHALENRLADLQENLNRQGVRINEVTISVEPHAFEKNLEQNTNGNLMNESNAGAFSEREGNAAASHRTAGSIDVREGFDGKQTEEDELEASIMRDNGNTVSYLA
ncbi:MAG: flagellar hook-length control protein FliK [Lachnospiraceae bacterium]|nr:flagellar hook-length control protein FliK [Lachnospiraceae bacterium]